ncbi:TerC family protein [Pseudidiomarina sp. E22-M8]|uniref:TerC family protein n=1 Tax=Pseudidiomarina sp. E22-M8 TaxID=3424768 RepID=UPI00403C17FF
MFEWIFLPEAWIALATLTALEVVLGIDNIIFISILVGRLPEAQRQKARQIGLLLAMGMRILLLLGIVWVMGLTEPLFSVFDFAFSGRDLILFFGGLFLLAKSTLEIHHSLEGVEEQKTTGKVATFGAIITQIAIIDIVFSLDSVITAVGLVDYVAVMIIAVVVAVLVMMLAAKAIGEFVDSHPTIKMLALSFLILIGFTLMGEGLGFHVPKGYVYFAMAFSLIVELLNIKVRKRNKPMHLKKRIAED